MEINVKIETPTKVTRKLTITVPTSWVNNSFQKKVLDFQKKAKVPGFRAGHVPVALVRKQFAQDLEHTVVDSLISDTLYKAMQDNKLRAVGQPTVEPIEKSDHLHAEEGKEFKYVATVEVMPEVDAKEYKGLSLTQDKVEVSNADIDTVVSHIQNDFANVEPVERAANDTDFVEFEFAGKAFTKDGVKTPESLKGKRGQFLGVGELLPEFEKNLVGMKSGDKKTFKMTYAADYPEKDLAGNEAEFTVEVFEVKQKVLPSLDEEFAKQAGYESIEDMRKKAEVLLLKNRNQESERKLRNDLLKVLVEKNPFEVPSSLIRAQMKEIATDFSTQLEREGFTKKMVEEALTTQAADLKTRAENQVRAGFLLHAVAKQEKIEVTAKKKEEEIKKYADSLGRQVKEIEDYFAKEASRAEGFEFRILEEMVIDFIVKHAKIKEVKATVQA